MVGGKRDGGGAGNFDGIHYEVRADEDVVEAEERGLGSAPAPGSISLHHLIPVITEEEPLPVERMMPVFT